MWFESGWKQAQVRPATRRQEFDDRLATLQPINSIAANPILAAKPLLYSPATFYWLFEPLRTSIPIQQPLCYGAMHAWQTSTVVSNRALEHYRHYANSINLMWHRFEYQCTSKRVHIEQLNCWIACRKQEAVSIVLGNRQSRIEV